MKILVVDADGLLLEDWRAVPNCDPLSTGLALYKRLVDAESVLLVTQADLLQFTPWALQYGITYTWAVNPEGPESAVTAAQSFVGRQHGTIPLYVTTNEAEARDARVRGVPASCFYAPVEQNLFKTSSGSGWATVYEAKAVS